MSDLFVIELPSEDQAESLREMLLAMQNEYQIENGDAVVAIADSAGRVKLNQLFHPVGRGAAPRQFWGSLIGLLFILPPAGGAIPAAARGLGRLAELGLGDAFVKSAARTVQSGNAALFLLVRNTTTDKLVTALRRVGGTVLKSPFDELKEDVLREALAGVQAASAAGSARRRRGGRGRT